MKVGVLTLPLVDNYGGILQAVALCNYLEMQGHEVVLLQKPLSTPRGPKSLLKSIVHWLLLRIPFHNIKNIRSNLIRKQQAVARKRFHRPFIEGAIRKISPDLYNTNDLRSFAERQHFDAIIVGSDQVWRKRYINDSHYLSYFLDFVDGKTCRKISYAASFGNEHWEGTGDTERIGTLLSDFTAISTREQSGVRICQDTFGYAGATSLLDPTLLVDRDFYINRIITPHVSDDFNTQRLLTYVLDEDPDKATIIQHVKDTIGTSAATHLKGFNLSHRLSSVPEWVASFRLADFVVTDSYHGMLFSIIFEKDFIVIGNLRRGLERFTSMLSQLELDDRMIIRKDDFRPELCKPIDYKRVNNRLQSLRIQATDFLSECLS